MLHPLSGPQKPFLIEPSDPSGQEHLNFFFTETAPLLNSVLHLDLWKNVAARATTAKSALRESIIALSWQHQVYAQSVSGIDDSSTILAGSQAYLRAISALRSLLSIAGFDTELALQSCLLLIIVESLRKNQHALLVHLRAGLSIIKTNAISDKVLTAFYGVGVSTILNNHDVSTFHLLEETILTRTHDFRPHLSLRDLSCNVTTLIVEVYRYCSQGILDDDALSTLGTIQSKESLLRQIADLEAYNNASQAGTDEQQRFKALLVARLLIAGVMVKCSVTRCQTSYDLYHTEFLQAVRLCAVYLGNKRQNDFFTINSGIIATLHLIAMLCRDKSIRLEALKLLSLCPRYDGPWDAKATYNLVHAVISFEENRAQELGDQITIPDEARVYIVLPEPYSEKLMPRNLKILYKPAACTGFAIEEILVRNLAGNTNTLCDR